MNEFKQLHLKGYGPFKDQTFKFTPGLSVIYGLNRSSGKYSLNGNAAGKSLFFSSLVELLFDNPVVGEKEDRIQKGTRELGIIINKKRVTISRKDSKIKIGVDGVDKSGRTPTISRQWISDNFPISEEEFNTFCFIDSRIPHPLVMGTSTERRRFFTSFFGLDKLDDERKLFSLELTRLSKIRAGLDELKSEYRRQKSELLDKEGVAKLTAHIEKLNIRHRKLVEANTEAQDVARLLEFKKNSKDAIAELLTACAGDINQESFSDALKTVKWNIEDNSKKLKLGTKYTDYIKSNKRYNEALEHISPGILKYVDRIGKCKIGRDRYNDHLKEYNRIKAIIDDLDLEAPTFVDTIKYDLLDLEIKRKSVLHNIEHSEKFDKGVCYACGQDVEVKDIGELRSELKRIERRIAECKEYNEYRIRVKEYNKAKGIHNKLLPELREHKEKAKKYKVYSEAYNVLKDLPAKPEKYTGKMYDIEITGRMLDEDKARLQTLRFCRPHLETIIAVCKLDDSKVDTELAERLNSVQQKLANLSAKLEVQKVLRNNAKQVLLKLVELKKELVDEEPLKILMTAYKDTAIKRMAIQAISQRLMQTVNKYAKIIFPEDYRFEFRWDSSKLQLLVHRNYKGKVNTSDVRKLSGAESKLFTFVLILALLSFVPSSKRSNLMIMDEPASSFGPETSDRFKSILPVLNKIIPVLIIITPKPEEVYENSVCYTVIKEDGVSRIAKGHPNTIKAK